MLTDARQITVGLLLGIEDTFTTRADAEPEKTGKGATWASAKPDVALQIFEAVQARDAEWETFVRENMVPKGEVPDSEPPIVVHFKAGSMVTTVTGEAP